MSMQNQHIPVPGVAVVGTGYWGRNLVRNYHRLGALRVVCDKNADQVDAMLRNYPGATGQIAFSQVLDDPAVDAVAVATPAETHYRLAREALLAGKHVFVEKPMTLHETEAEELIALAAERGRTLMVGHLLRYHPAFIRLLELVRGRELGGINYIYSNRLNLGKIRREENSLWSFAPHDISMILALAGDVPEHVSAEGGNYLHRRIADVTTTHLSFASGLKAHIFVSWLHPFKEQKLVVVGDRKMAVFDDTRDWDAKLLLYPHRVGWQDGAPVVDKAEAEAVPLAPSEPLREECAHFLQCVAEGGTPRTDGAEGLRVLAVLNAAQACLDERREAGASAPRHPGVHPTAVVDEGAHIGEGTRIWHFSHVLPGSRIGRDCVIGQNVSVGPDVSVGDGCKIQNNVSVFAGVTLEDGVFCGPSMVFTNVHTPRSHIPRMAEKRETLVRRGATLGANCTILCGHTIGRYAFVGAGAVVTADVPDHALVFGNPARHAGWVCACGERLGEDLACPSCGDVYRRSGAGLAPAS